MISFRPKMFEESAESKAPKGFWLNFLIFILVFLIGALLESIIPSILAIRELVTTLMESDTFVNGSLEQRMQESMQLTTEVMLGNNTIMISSLLCTVFATLTAIIYCRFIEKRSLGSMGFRARKAGKHYLQGVAVGFIMISLVSLLPVIFGVRSLKVVSDFNIGTIGIYLCGFLLQGMSEETICRGYFMNTLGGKSNPAVAIAASSIMFGIAHGMNPGFGWFPLFNLVLFGVFAAVYIIAFDDIWGACAIHSIWNFAQGNIYGLSVSGAYKVDSFLQADPVSTEPLLTGGDFGVEGSIFTTIVLAAGIIVLLIKMKRDQSEAKA